MSLTSAASLFSGDGASPYSADVSVGGLLSIVASAGLPVPAVAIDFGIASAGAHASIGSAGGTFAVTGATYQQAFPETVGGLAAGFDTVASDVIAASLASIANVTTGGIAGFVVFAGDSSAAIDNLVSKRNAAFGAGWELRFAATGVPTFLAENSAGDGGATVDATLSSDHLDEADHYLGFSLDRNTNKVYCASDLDSEVTSTGNASGSYTSDQPIRFGRDQRNAFGGGAGLLRYAFFWTGTGAEGLREADWDALWAGLGG